MDKDTFIKRYMNAIRQLMALQAQVSLEMRWQWDALGLSASITDEDVVVYGFTAVDLSNAVNTIEAMQALLEADGNAHSGNLYRVAGTGTAQPHPPPHPLTP